MVFFFFAIEVQPEFSHSEYVINDGILSHVEEVGTTRMVADAANEQAEWWASRTWLEPFLRSLLLVREELPRTLKSTGGRPIIEGADRRFKIPLIDKRV